MWGCSSHTSAPLTSRKPYTPELFRSKTPALLSVYLPPDWQHIGTLSHRACPQITILFTRITSNLSFAAANCEHHSLGLQGLWWEALWKGSCINCRFNTAHNCKRGREEEREGRKLYFGGVCKVFARCWVDLLAARPTKSSPYIHFVYPFSLSLIPTSSLLFNLCLSFSLSLLIWLTVVNLWNNNRDSSGPPRLTAQPSHLRHRLNKQHDLPIKKAFTLIVLKQDLNTTCSFSCRMPKVLANANQAALTCLKMKKWQWFWRGGWGGGRQHRWKLKKTPHLFYRFTGVVQTLDPCNSVHLSAVACHVSV